MRLRVLGCGAAMLLAFQERVPGQPQAGGALRCEGTNSYLSAGTDAAFNAYPFTTTVWLRTTNQDAAAQGILTKYRDTSYEGWTVYLTQGRVRAWYLRGGGVGTVLDGGAPLDGGFVADGQWHHLAFAVDGSGGRLMVDGAQMMNRPWAGVAGPCASSEPLQFGRYYNYPSAFQGDLDEATVWTRALSPDEVAYLRHRRLTGKEDGLLALWHFDEAQGVAPVDSTGRGYTLSLLGHPVAVSSWAPLVFNPVAGTALKGNGATSYVAVPHAPALNAFPLTAMAWVRTTNASLNIDALISKYGESDLNGYSMFVRGGRLRAWYFKNGNAYIWNPGTLGGDGYGLDGGFIADGFWHHVALVVDGTGGRLIVDGTQAALRAWNLFSGQTAGAPTTVTNLQFGQYWNSPPYQSFTGVLDEVALWNAALTTAQLNAIRNLPLAGNEAGLVGYWRFDEASGTSATDSTGHGHGGAFVGAPVRVGSTAFLGDRTSTVLAQAGLEAYGRNFAVEGAGSLRDFRVNETSFVRRYDDFGAPTTSRNVTVLVDYALLNAGTKAVIPLRINEITLPVTLAPYNMAVQPQGVDGTSSGRSLSVEPAAGVQLDSVNALYHISITHRVDGAPPQTTDQYDLPPARLLHFNGHLLFGNLITLFTNLLNTPAALSINPPDFLSTQLALAPNAAFIQGKPQHTFGDGSALAVRLLPNGDAVYVSGPVTVQQPEPDLDQAAGICFSRDYVRLSTAGAKSVFTVLMPTGLGYADAISNRLLQTEVEFSTEQLTTQDLLPAAPALFYTFFQPVYFAEETKPLWLPVHDIEWHVAEGQLVLNRSVNSVYHVRAAEYQLLANPALALIDSTAAAKKSNDRYYAAASPGATPWIVRGDSNCNALLSMELSVAAGSLNAHFPYNTFIQWTAGTLVISNDLIVASQSQLLPSHSIDLAYARDCLDAACGTTIGPDLQQFTAAGGLLRFTPDGGLMGDGSILAKPLTWGYVDGAPASPRFAQRTDPFVGAAFHMPGSFLRGDQTTLGLNDRPAAILFSGFGQPGDPSRVERPLAPAYYDGFANYAGLNFRVGTDGAKNGSSLLAGVPAGPYPLTGRSKYYTRPGGVSGIHESAAGSFTTQLYGYGLTFFNYKLSYLDSHNWQSRTDGGIKLPGLADAPAGPAGFTQEFAEMEFGCRGELEQAVIPSASGPKHLDYWDATVKPIALEFRGNPQLGCTVTDSRFLVLGVEMPVAQVPQPLHGQLGFKPNGNLVTAADNLSTGTRYAGAGVDSRFRLPSALSLQGPGNSLYPLAISSDGYLNNWEDPDKPGRGFVSFAGKINLPFFEDMKVHLHTSANKDDSDVVYLMGGWPAADSTAEDRGWTVGPHDFFNDSTFDAAHRGWPAGVSLDGYRRSGTERYHPRAQQSWLKVVDFDYPLTWSPAARNFNSFGESETKLLVLEVKNRLKNLTPSRAEIAFGAEFGLPNISVANLAFDALEGTTQAGQALAGALGSAANATQITVGLAAMKRLLASQPQDLFRPSLDAWITPYVDALYNSLSQYYASSLNNYAGFKSIIPIYINLVINTNGQYLVDRLKTLNDPAVGPGRFFQQANQSISTALAGMDQAAGLIDGSRVRNLVNALISQEAPQFAGAIPGNVLDGLLAQASPSLQEIGGRLQTARGKLVAATTGLDAELNRIPIDNAAFYQTIATGVAGALQSYFDRAGAASGDFFAQKSAAEIKAAFRRLIEEQFFASPIPAQYQLTLKQRLYDPDSLMRESLDNLFAQANQILKDGLASAAAGLDNTIKGFLGDLGESVGAAKLTGFAAINGDDLSEIRLDAMLRLRVPDNLDFNGYLRILQLNSDNAPEGCRPATGSATEITMGARDVPLAWISPQLRASIGGKITLDGRTPVGLGGSFEMNGPLSFEVFTLQEMAATLAFGKYENYIGARARAKVNRQEYAVGVFFGRTCNIDPLMLVDKEVATVLPQNYPLTGVYIYGEAWFPLNEALGIPSSCFLTLRAGGGLGAFYFKTGLDGPPTYGGKILYGISGELLCIVDVQGEIRGVGVKYGDTLTIRAIGEVSGEVGVCPLCKDFSKTVTLTLRAKNLSPGTDLLDTDNVEYDIDF